MRILKHKKGILNSSHFYLHFEGVLTNFEFNFLFMIELLEVIDYIRLPRPPMPFVYTLPSSRKFCICIRMLSTFIYLAAPSVQDSLFQCILHY